MSFLKKVFKNVTVRGIKQHEQEITVEGLRHNCIKYESNLSAWPHPSQGEPTAALLKAESTREGLAHHDSARFCGVMWDGSNCTLLLSDGRTGVTPVQTPKNIHATQLTQHLTANDQSADEVPTSDLSGPNGGRAGETPVPTRKLTDI